MITILDLAKMIDHSLLHPTFTDKDLREGCFLAADCNVATVCIKPYAVPLAVNLLKKTDVHVCSVVGFPHGNSATGIKTSETLRACNEGATEIDMVINIGKAIGGDWSYIYEEIAVINETAVKNGADLKVIFENDYLDDTIIEKLCRICSEIGVAYIKTSTGYGFVKQDNGTYTYRGATARHLKLMRKCSDDKVAVKAAGGIRTLEDLLFVRSLGISRVGATATKTILDEARNFLVRGENLEDLIPCNLSSEGVI